MRKEKWEINVDESEIGRGERRVGESDTLVRRRTKGREENKYYIHKSVCTNGRGGMGGGREGGGRYLMILYIVYGERVAEEWDG